jgi:hypothetical protein
MPEMNVKIRNRKTEKLMRHSFAMVKSYLAVLQAEFLRLGRQALQGLFYYSQFILR